MSLIKLRLFAQKDGFLISKWIADQSYQNFFRTNSLIPTEADCYNYPQWCQNLVMMIDYDGETVGMVNAYAPDYKNQIIKSGLIIDKSFRRKRIGYLAYLDWVHYLFNTYNFRKVIALIVDDKLVEPLENMGFLVEGTFVKECFVDGQYCDEIRLAAFKDSLKRV